MPPVLKFNLTNIKNNSLSQIIPEFYELKEVIENQGWHDNDSVFNHTISVLENLELILSNAQPSVKINKEVLFLSALLHDIGKKETLTGQDKNNLSHEKIGFNKAKMILERLNLSEEDKSCILSIIKHHSELHFILNKRDDAEINYSRFKTSNPLFLELTILSFADTLGSQLNKINPNDFSFRIIFYKKALSEIIIPSNNIFKN